MLSEIKYKDAKFMYKQYLATKQQIKALVMELGNFFTEECLNGRKWWNCILKGYIQNPPLKFHLFRHPPLAN